MEFLTEHNVIAFLITFLLVLILVIQIQMGMIGKQIEEIKESMSVKMWWNLQVRSCKPDPLGADIVHVREDRRNGARLAGRFGSPGGRVKMFDKNLVHAIIGGKDLDCGSAELSVNLVLTRSHGSLLLDL